MQFQWLFVYVLTALFFPIIPFSSSPSHFDSFISEVTRNNHEDWVHNDLKVATFNTWGLPIKLPGMDQTTRFNVLPDSLLDLNADILCLQETFSKRLRKKIMETLPHSYYHYSDYLCNRRQAGLLMMDCYGGLMTWSKYPIVYESFHAFPFYKGMSIIEQTGLKGFLFTTINFKGTYINVVNTHLYSGLSDKAEYFRLQQLAYLHNVLVQLEQFKAFPTLFAGDFNTSHPEVTSGNDILSPSVTYPLITGEMGFKDTCPTLDDNSYTYDAFSNSYVNKKKERNKIDYIFYRETQHTAMTITERKTIFTENNLSDHNGYMSCFTLSYSTSRDNNPSVLIASSEN
ncbi:MAG TPA: endonuclease/exonuclease/phosphatase family protein [Saprospiraceae bacterium]|mgnify:CR=1 FL=1|nr:endonuclease/exonuclease/phosphatase family protein [Saprospiraceae bacterium]